MSTTRTLPAYLLGITHTGTVHLAFTGRSSASCNRSRRIARIISPAFSGRDEVIAHIRTAGSVVTDHLCHHCFGDTDLPTDGRRTQPTRPGPTTDTIRGHIARIETDIEATARLVTRMAEMGAPADQVAARRARVETLRANLAELLGML